MYRHEPIPVLVDKTRGFAFDNNLLKSIEPALGLGLLQAM